MSEEKCPTCKGPVERRLVQAVKYKKSGKEVIKQYAYRSTAAEQLEEVHAANRELIRQHKDDIRSGDIRAKAIRRGLDQLADKERELEDNQIKRDLIKDLTSESKKMQTKLAAANVVVEAAETLTNFIDTHGADMQVTGSEMDLDVYHECILNTQNALGERRKLQGGDDGAAG